jgi:hypothetical protein
LLAAVYAITFAPGFLQNPPPSLVPLAYVRRLAVAPAALAVLPEAPLPPKPPASDKKAAARWEQRRRGREAYARLRAESLTPLDEEIAARLGRLPGLLLVPPPPDHLLPALWNRPALPLPESPERLMFSQNGPAIAPLAAPMEELARAAQADAALVVLMDRFGTHSGLEREVWMRLTAWLKPGGDRPLCGPFYVYGVGRSGRKLFGFGKGYQKSDAQIARDAAAQAARQIAHALETGQEALFTRDAQVAIVPALVPAYTLKRLEESPEKIAVPLPALQRQSDVLLQPELGPVAEIVASDDVEDALRALNLRPADFWSASGAPDTERMAALAGRLRAGYVFISRMTGVELNERAVTVPDDGTPHAGVERQAEAEAEAVLFRPSDGRILWRDRLAGSTAARTEYVRHQARIRTDEQCVVDAARIAFALLRFSFEDYKKRFER